MLFEEGPVRVDVVVCEVGWELFREVAHILLDAVPFGFSIDINFPGHLLVELWSQGSVNDDNLVVWDAGNHSVVFHKAGLVGAIEVQDVLEASDFMLDLGEVVVCKYFQDPFMWLFLGTAWEDFASAPVDVWDVEVTA